MLFSFMSMRYSTRLASPSGQRDNTVVCSIAENHCGYWSKSVIVEKHCATEAATSVVNSCSPLSAMPRIMPSVGLQSQAVGRVGEALCAECYQGCSMARFQGFNGLSPSGATGAAAAADDPGSGRC